MPQTQSSSKSINKNLSIGFANDNFCVFFPNYFPSKTFKNFKNSPHSFQNASSLFSFHSKTTHDWVYSAPLQNPFSLKSTSSFSTKSEGFSQTITLASSASASSTVFEQLINNLSASIGAGMSKSKSDTSTTTHNNSSLVADSGTIKINTLNDATIKGANLLAQNITLNTQGDLTVASLQDSYMQKGSSFGLSLGGGAGVSGGGSANFGINYGSSKTDRVWTDNQTSILGTNSVTINTGNNTDIIGAVIANSTNGKIGSDAGSPCLGGASSCGSRAMGVQYLDGGNLALNTGTLTFEDIQDSEKQKSSGFGFSTSIGIGGGSSANNTTGQSTAPATNPNQQNNFYPTGSTTISANNSGYKKEQTTKATIGAGAITIHYCPINHPTVTRAGNHLPQYYCNQSLPAVDLWAFVQKHSRLKSVELCRENA